MAIAVLLATCVYAQAPAFEVASIRQNKSGPGLQSARLLPGGRAEATNIALDVLIRLAYGPQVFQTLDRIVGGPSWIHSDRFDIVAKAAGDRADLPAMLQALLAERFHLKTHTEMRAVAVYALVLASKDGTLGPQLHVSQADCADVRVCGIKGPFGDLTGTGTTMAELAQDISNDPAVGRPVLERTGLTGKFDLRLKFAPAIMAASVTNASIDSGVTVFTALPDQLGLKLQSDRGSVPFLVIDHVDRPTED